MNTKQKIIDVSIDLFSKKGYDSVSLRQIAEEVGIKKSSIYSHFPSKEAILMEIFNYFTNLFEHDALLNDKDLVLDENNEILLESPKLFYHKGSEAIRALLSEERNLKICKLIFIQMHHNENIRLFFQNEIIEKPLTFWEGFFSILKEKGIIKKDSNVKLLAKEYYCFPIYLLFYFFLKYDDIPSSSLDNFFKETEDHAKFLLDSIKVIK